jgi:hypothetical protein
MTLCYGHYVTRQAQWQADRIKRGLCATCGERPLAKRSKRRCRTCLNKDKERKRVLPMAKSPPKSKSAMDKLVESFSRFRAEAKERMSDEEFRWAEEGFDQIVARVRARRRRLLASLAEGKDSTSSLQSSASGDK